MALGGLGLMLLVNACTLLLFPEPAAAQGAAKYSREKNQAPEDEANRAIEFRIAKLNQVWEKAQR
ncbi:hypothetical protein chiPu_0028349, partial [Chiloscyllium punctatum]|nr:hypothetical protein [Chiloscyllium punctatum]